LTWLTFKELNAQRADYDAAVTETPEIDHFCSSSVWVLPAQKKFAPHAQPLVWQSDAGFISLMAWESYDDVVMACPLECGWGLASPFAGPEPDRLVSILATIWKRAPIEIDTILLSGLPEHGVWRDAILNRFLRTHRVGSGQICLRRYASLADGVDGFLSRRSRKFRENLRRVVRVADASGVSYEYHQGGKLKDLFDRIMAVESESWKGRAKEGIESGSPRQFYKDILRRLLKRNDARVLFARRNDEDIAYVMGGIGGSVYRGLQVSYHHDHQELAPGNLVQFEIIKRLCEEGVETYDLGTDMPYKERWAELSFETITWALFRD
jgi:hypothetical protein